jgi:SAM-dependent methyltransferase
VAGARPDVGRAVRRLRLALTRTSAADVDFVTRCYRQILRREPDPRGLRRKVRALHAGTTRGDTVLALVRSEEYADRTVRFALTHTDGLSDEQFLRHAYRVLLLREPDPSGLESYGRLLAEGETRDKVLRLLVASDEHVNRVAAAAYDLPDLRAVRPEAYVERPDRSGAGVLTFNARTPADFDWLEEQILANGYYDKPGIWGSEVNLDKRLMAEMIACLRPARVLDFGCASGAVLVALDALGIRGEGVEISPAAAARADRQARGDIHVGDLLEVNLPVRYDVVSGFDVYEHLNPNRIDTYLSRVAELLAPGGFALCNIPAFGDDEVFGTVFPRTLADWDAEAEQGQVFSHLPVDGAGYPYHGHLVWADSRWWVEHWSRAGLRREGGLEQAMHERYDAHLAQSAPARRSFYVFSKDADPARVAALTNKIATTPSMVLAAG